MFIPSMLNRMSVHPLPSELSTPTWHSDISQAPGVGLG